jgi:hypothetical protein
MCQVASSDKATFARFLLVFFTVLTVFSNLFAIKAKSIIRSLPLVLNLLWDDRHLCHIAKIEKENTVQAIDTGRTLNELWVLIAGIFILKNNNYPFFERK